MAGSMCWWPPPISRGASRWLLLAATPKEGGGPTECDQVLGAARTTDAAEIAAAVLLRR